MKLKNSDLNLISSVLLFVALVMIYVYGNETIVPLVLLIASLVLTITLLIRRRTPTEKEPESDERTRKNGAYGLSYSWMIGIAGLIFLFWAEYFGIWQPGTLIALGISILLFLLSAVIFLVYLSRKGDTNV